jgi:hypothetical protein
VPARRGALKRRIGQREIKARQQKKSDRWVSVRSTQPKTLAYLRLFHGGAAREGILRQRFSSARQTAVVIELNG